MNKQLSTMYDKLEQLISRAEELADSENERTSERYTNVLSSLEAARDALEEAISELETK